MPPQCMLLGARPVAQNIVMRSSRSVQRTYATSDPAPVVKNPLRRRKGGDLGSHLPKHIIPHDAYIPAYPYGDRTLFKQANRGLYGEQMIQFGNNVSDKTETKTRRFWKPNVLHKSLYSVALKKKVKLRITSKVLKTMDREGGLDEYLLKDSEHRIKELGPLGWALRWTLMQTPHVIDRMRVQAAALGLDQATIDAQWPTREMLAAQRLLQPGFVRALDLVGEDEYGDMDQELADASQQEVYTKREQLAMREAGLEYTKAVKAAQRYLSRQLVESEEAGLKLAFIRAKERQEAAERLKRDFANKLNHQFSSQDITDARTQFSLPATLTDDAVRKILYNQWRRRQIEQAGSYQAWREAINDKKEADIRSHFQKNPGGADALQPFNKKEHYNQLIQEAETAASNTTMPASRRRQLETAITKAEMAIQAALSGGKTAYAESVVHDMRRAQSLRKNPSKTVPIARPTEQAGSDAWGALVNSSKGLFESRADA
ncbi:hypothetical protein ACEQ8H_003918 [Pleosporales sp. CAS-2024a]